MNRRSVLRALALGGGLVAGELWVPGARKVFLPARKIADGNIYVPISHFVEIEHMSIWCAGGVSVNGSEFTAQAIAKRGDRIEFRPGSASFEVQAWTDLDARWGKA